MTSNTLPAKYAFSPALSHQQVEEIRSPTGLSAVTICCLMAVLTRTSDQLIDAWRGAPEAFLELLENAPGAISNVKLVVEFLDNAHKRLMLAGEIAFNGAGEVSDPEN